MSRARSAAGSHSITLSYSGNRIGRAGLLVSGLVLLGVYIWLVVTGYLLYYAGGDAFRAAVSLGHWTVGLVALVFLLLHRRIRRGAGARH